MRTRLHQHAIRFPGTRSNTLDYVIRYLRDNVQSVSPINRAFMKRLVVFADHVMEGIPPEEAARLACRAHPDPISAAVARGAAPVGSVPRCQPVSKPVEASHHDPGRQEQEHVTRRRQLAHTTADALDARPARACADVGGTRGQPVVAPTPPSSRHPRGPAHVCDALRFGPG